MGPKPNKKKKAKIQLPLPVKFLMKAGEHIGGGGLEYIKEILPDSSSVVEEAVSTITELKEPFKNKSSEITSTFKGIFRFPVFKALDSWFWNKSNDFGMGDWEDSLDFDVADDSDENEYESLGSTITDSNERALDQASDKISETVVETSHKLMETQVASLASITNSMEKTVGIITSGFETVNKTLKDILEVVTKNSSALIELSARMTGKETEEESSYNRDQFDFKSFLRRFSFDNYFKNVKSNFGNKLGMLGFAPMIVEQLKGVLSDPTGLGGSVMGDLLFKGGSQALITHFTNTMLPGFESIIKKLDSTINKEITRGLLSLGRMRGDSNILIDTLADIFGVSSSLGGRSEFKSTRFEQKAIPFDSTTKEYITKAIPEYLRAITAAVTGKDLVYDTGRRSLIEKSKFVHEKRAEIYRASTDHLDRVFNSETYSNAGFNRNDIDKVYEYDNDAFYIKYKYIIFDYLMNLAKYGNFNDQRIVKALQDTPMTGGTNDDRIFTIIKQYISNISKDIGDELNKLTSEEKGKIIFLGKLIQAKVKSATDPKNNKALTTNFGNSLQFLSENQSKNRQYAMDRISESFPEHISDINTNELYASKYIIKASQLHAAESQIKSVENTIKNLEKLNSKEREKDTEYEKKLSEARAKLKKLNNDLLTYKGEFKEYIKPKEKEEDLLGTSFVRENEFEKSSFQLLSNIGSNGIQINSSINVEDIKSSIKENTDRIIEALNPVKIVSEKTAEIQSKDLANETNTVDSLKGIKDIISTISSSITSHYESIATHNSSIITLLKTQFDNISKYFTSGVVIIESGATVDPKSSKSKETGKPKTEKVKVSKRGNTEIVTVEEENNSIPVVKSESVKSTADPKNENVATNTALAIAKGVLTQENPEDSLTSDEDKFVKSTAKKQENSLNKLREHFGNFGTNVKKVFGLVRKDRPEEGIAVATDYAKDIVKTTTDIIAPDLELAGNNINVMLAGGKRYDKFYDENGEEKGVNIRNVKGIFPLIGESIMNSFDSLFNKSNNKGTEAAEKALNESSEKVPGAAIKENKKPTWAKIRRNITNAFIGATGGGILGGPIGLLLGTIAGGAASFIDLDSKIGKFLFGDFFNPEAKTDENLKMGFLEKEIRGWIIPWKFQFKKFQETLTYNFTRNIKPIFESLSTSFKALFEKHFFRDLFDHIMNLPIFQKVLIPFVKKLGSAAGKLLEGISGGLKNLLPAIFDVFVNGGVNVGGSLVGVGGKFLTGVVSTITGTTDLNKEIWDKYKNQSDTYKEDSETLETSMLSSILKRKRNAFLKKADEDLTNQIFSMRMAMFGTDEAVMPKYYNSIEEKVDEISEGVKSISENISQLKEDNAETKEIEKSKAEEKAKKAKEEKSANDKKSEKANEGASLSAEKSKTKSPSTSSENIKSQLSGLQQVNAATQMGADPDLNGNNEVQKLSSDVVTKSAIEEKPKESKNILQRLISAVSNHKNKKTTTSSGAGDGKSKQGLDFVSSLAEKAVKWAAPVAAIYFALKGIQDMGPEQFLQSILDLFGLGGSGNGGSGSGSGGSSSSGSKGPIIRSPLNEAARIVGYDNLAAAMAIPFAPIKYKDTNITANNMTNAIHMSDKLYAIGAFNGAFNKSRENFILGAYDVNEAEILNLKKELNSLDPTLIKKQRNSIKRNISEIENRIAEGDYFATDELNAAKQQLAKYDEQLLEKRSSLLNAKQIKRMNSMKRNITPLETQLKKQIEETKLNISTIEKQMAAGDYDAFDLDLLKTSKQQLPEYEKQLANEVKTSEQQLKQRLAEYEGQIYSKKSAQINKKIAKLEKQNLKYEKVFDKISSNSKGGALLEEAAGVAAKTKHSVGRVALRAGVGGIAGGMIARGAASVFVQDIDRKNYNTEEEYNKAVEEREAILGVAQGTGSAIGGVTTAFKGTFIDKILDAVKDNLIKLKDRILTHFKTNPKVIQSVTQFFDKITSNLTTKAVNNILKKTGTTAAAKLSSQLSKFALNSAGVASTGGIANVALATITGAASAFYSTEWMFGVTPADVDPLMRVISGILGGIFDGTPIGIVELADLILDPIFHIGIRQWLARLIYRALENPDQNKTLDARQKRFDEELKRYNEQYRKINGRDLKSWEFNDMVNKRALGSMWSGKAKFKDGKYVFDAGGGLETTGGFIGLFGFKGNKSYAKDENGKVLLDKNGKPIVNIDQYGNELNENQGLAKYLDDTGRNLKAFFLGYKAKYATDEYGRAHIIPDPNNPNSYMYGPNINPRPVEGAIHHINNAVDLGFKTLGDLLRGLGIGVVNTGKIIGEVGETTGTAIMYTKQDIHEGTEKIVAAINENNSNNKSNDKNSKDESNINKPFSVKTKHQQNVLKFLYQIQAGQTEYSYSTGGFNRPISITASTLSEKLIDNPLTNDEIDKLKKKNFTDDQIATIPNNILRKALKLKNNTGDFYHLFPKEVKPNTNTKPGTGGPEDKKYQKTLSNNPWYDRWMRGNDYKKSDKKNNSISNANKKSDKKNNSTSNANMKDLPKKTSSKSITKSNKKSQSQEFVKLAEKYYGKEAAKDIVANNLNSPILGSSLNWYNSFYASYKKTNKKTNKQTNNDRKYKFPCSRIPQVTSPFGVWRNGSNGPYQHKGVDLDFSYEDVLACCDGVILDVAMESESGGFGNCILQDSPDHYGILYAHLDYNGIKCKVGDRVKQGEILARSGASGVGTGPHLHLEFRKFKDNRKMTKSDFWYAVPRPTAVDPMGIINGENTAISTLDNDNNSSDSLSNDNKSSKNPVSKFALGLLSLIPGFNILNNAIENGLSSLLGFDPSADIFDSSSDTLGSTPYDGTYTPIKNGTLEENRKAIYSFLRTKGLSPAGASAVIGNLYAESTLNPLAVNEDSGAYGIGQWLDSRQTNLKRKYPSNYNTLDSQLKFLYSELERDTPNLLKALKSQNGDSSVLAERVCREFERPSPKEIAKSLLKRQNYAKNTLNKNWGGPEPIGLKDMNSLLSGVTSNKMIDIPNPIDSLISVLNNILNELKQIKGINSTNTNIMGGMASGSIRQKEQVRTLLNRINNYSTSHTPIPQQINPNILNFIKGF